MIDSKLYSINGYISENGKIESFTNSFIRLGVQVCVDFATIFISNLNNRQSLTIREHRLCQIVMGFRQLRNLKWAFYQERTELKCKNWVLAHILNSS